MQAHSKETESKGVGSPELTKLFALIDELYSMDFASPYEMARQIGRVHGCSLMVRGYMETKKAVLTDLYNVYADLDSQGRAEIKQTLRFLAAETEA